MTPQTARISPPETNDLLYYSGSDKRGKVAKFHRALHGWYREHGRHHLPWRITQDAYAIYISEVMLQQTQVATVLERYYFPFLEQFPTLQALADAPLEQVLKAWEGLGYYSRARNLHRAVQLAAPTLPDTPEALQALPGIGKNTAHAIACFGFGRPVPIMEANLKRVLHRIFALQEAPETLLWEKAEALLNKRSAFHYNQAMMDLGAMVCRKRNPLCGECPAQSICEGQHAPDAYPTAKQRKATPVRKRNIIVVEQQGRYFLAPRETRFLGGLYSFAEIDREQREFSWNGKRYALKSLELLGGISQSYSHFTLDAEVYLLTLKGKQQNQGWFDVDEIASLPLSKADQKVWKLLRSRC